MGMLTRTSVDDAEGTGTGSRAAAGKTLANLWFWVSLTLYR